MRITPPRRNLSTDSHLGKGVVRSFGRNVSAPVGTHARRLHGMSMSTGMQNLVVRDPGYKGVGQ